MKMHKAIGEARASTRSIFTLALVGVLLSFTGQAFGQANEESGYCKWSAVDWQTDTVNTQGYAAADIAEDQGLSDLDAVDGNVIRFNGAIGPATDTTSTLTTLVFPTPLCDWDGDDATDTDYTNQPATFFNVELKCGATAATKATVDSGSNVFGTSTTATVNATHGADGQGTNGQVTFERTTTAATEPVFCTLELDWVGSNSLDGPITYDFQIAISPTPFAAPTLVRALPESSNSAYVEWTLVEVTTDPDGDGDSTNDNPTSYIIMAESDTMGAATPPPATIMADAIATPGTAQRQGGRISGLTSGADYSITVSARRGMGATENIGRTSAEAVSGVMDVAGTPTATTDVTPLRGYGKTGTGTTAMDHTFVISTGESVEIDPQTYLLNMAIHGRDDFGIDVGATGGANGDYAEYVRGAADDNAVFNYAITSNTSVEALYISTDPNTQEDDLIRLKGLKDGDFQPDFDGDRRDGHDCPFHSHECQGTGESRTAICSH